MKYTRPEVVRIPSAIHAVQCGDGSVLKGEPHPADNCTGAKQVTISAYEADE